MTFAAGKDVMERGGAASIVIVLSGLLKVDSAEGDPADAGDVIGMYETLAGVPMDATVTAITEAQVLRLDRGALFELLADHTDLLQGVFQFCASALARRQPTASPLSPR